MILDPRVRKNQLVILGPGLRTNHHLIPNLEVRAKHHHRPVLDLEVRANHHHLVLGLGVRTNHHHLDLGPAGVRTNHHLVNISAIVLLLYRFVTTRTLNYSRHSINFNNSSKFNQSDAAVELYRFKNATKEEKRNEK